jgi:hypothetical protein
VAGRQKELRPGQAPRLTDANLMPLLFGALGLALVADGLKWWVTGESLF